MVGESASSGADGVGFYHEHDGALRCAGAMENIFGDDDSLAWIEGDGAGIVLAGCGVDGVD